MHHDEDGQAAVELVAIVPAVLVIGLVAWQLVLVGHSAWLAAHAARAAARAELVGADGAADARAVVPRALEERVQVERGGGGAIRARVPVPLVHRAGGGHARVAARTSLEVVR